MVIINCFSKMKLAAQLGLSASQKTSMAVENEVTNVVSGIL